MASCNVVGDYINYSLKTTRLLLKIIFDKKYDESIFEELKKVYVDARYNNYLEPKGDDFISSIDYYLSKKCKELMKENKDKKYISEYLTVYLAMFFLDTDFDYDIDKTIDNLYIFRKDYLKIESSNFKKRFLDYFTEVIANKNNYINQFDSKELFTKYYLTNQINVYNAVLKYDIRFPKLYSNYAIDKVFNSGIINEDKIMALYYQVSSRLLKEIITGDFNSQFIVDFPISYLSKENKLSRLLKVIDNDISKDKISLKITFDDYNKNKEKISKLLSDGYNFTILIDDSYEHDHNNKRLITSLFKFIIINIDSKYYKYYESEKNIIKTKY